MSRNISARNLDNIFLHSPPFVLIFAYFPFSPAIYSLNVFSLCTACWARNPRAHVLRVEKRQWSISQERMTLEKRSIRKGSRQFLSSSRQPTASVVNGCSLVISRAPTWRSRCHSSSASGTHCTEPSSDGSRRSSSPPCPTPSPGTYHRSCRT